MKKCVKRLYKIITCHCDECTQHQAPPPAPLPESLRMEQVAWKAAEAEREQNILRLRQRMR